MKQTTNLKLNKPDYTDIADVGKLNENSDILDREVNDKLSMSKGGNVNGNVTFNGEINMNKTLTAKAIVGECLENAVKENSQKPITSGAVFSGLAEKSDRSHTHENATQSKAGLLSPNDKKKLDSISEGSNKTTVDTNLNSSSSNPVQNKAVTNALAQKSDKNHTHELSDINFTEEKSISLKCVYTYTVHAEGIAPDEGNHIVYWQVVNYTNFPVSSIDPMDGYTIGGKTYNLPYIQTITLSNANPPTFNPPSNVNDELNFYTYGGYVRYVSTSEYPEKKLKYSVGNTIVLDLGMVNTGVLPIENGGTGSETVQGARENLGLGSAATYNAEGSITTGNNSLVTGGTVAAYFNTLNLSSRTHIVIAAYDTKNPLKNNADYICTSTNASSVIKEALSKIKAGGKIELLDGTYQLNYKETEIQINTKNVTIEGSGFATAIKQPVDEGAGEARPIFAINAENVFIKNMMLCDVAVSSSVSMIMQKAQGALYRGVFFIYNGGNGNDSSCIEGSGNCCYTRLQSADCQKLF